jgi:cell division protein ZapA
MTIDAGDPTMHLDVAILGREYRIACAAGERDALLQAVALLDSRMREIRDSGKVSGIDRIAVMAALNIANDYLRERREPAARRTSPNGSGGEAAIDRPDAQRRIREMQAAIDDALAPQEKLF